jgi:hypothetical protein
MARRNPRHGPIRALLKAIVNMCYVRAGGPGVFGSGNWAELPDGRIIGRSNYSGVYLRDDADANGVLCDSIGNCDVNFSMCYSAQVIQNACSVR